MSRSLVTFLAVVLFGFMSTPGRGVALAESAFDDADTVELVGRIEAKETAEIRSRVTGFLAKVHFKEGEKVKKGQLLFEIDARELKAELEKAEGEHLVQKARNKLAEEKVDLYKPLVEEGTVTKEEWTKVNHELTETLAKLKAAEENLKAARQRLEATKIHAPIDGRAGLSRLAPGNLVKADGSAAPLLTTIVSLDPMRVYLEVDERTALRILRLAKEKKVLGLEVAVRVADEKEFSRKGQIDFVDNKINLKTGTLSVRAILANPDGMLLPGLVARVRLNLGAAKTNEYCWSAQPARSSDAGRMTRCSALLDNDRVACCDDLATARSLATTRRACYGARALGC